MSKILRLLAMVVLLLVVALAAALVQPDWARELGLHPGWAGRSGSSCVFPPDEKSLAMQARIAEKTRVTAQLLDGDLTLFEAAALFRRANEDGYPTLPPSLSLYQGDSEEETLCLQVIDWAEAQLLESFPRSGDWEIIAHLKDELRRHKEQNGKVILPDAVGK
jgi:hypothetical protein